MRRSLRLIVAAVVAGCASAGPPPGGPEDKLPPAVVRITPDTNAVNVHPDHVSFFFDETINDRGTGDQEIDRYFLLSPSNGAARVSWHRSRIDIAPRDGFKNGVAYTVTLIPGLTDLHNNRMKTGATVVFSTGPSIPPLRITGTVFDWAADRPAAQAYVEAVTPDSMRYMTQTDSVGRFTIATLPQGTFLVRAIIDQNNNRVLDRLEAYDTARVNTPQARPVELLTAVRDTLAARILTANVTDSLTLTLNFDRSLDPTAPLSIAMFRLIGPDSVVVPLRAALSPRESFRLDSLTRKATADSLRRVDSLAGKPLPPIVQPPTTLPNGRPLPAPPPKPSLPPPFTNVTLKLTRPLAPNTTYRVSVTNVKALSGKVQSSERTFTTPKPPPPPAKVDSTAKPATPPTTPPTRPPRT